MEKKKGVHDMFSLEVIKKMNDDACRRYQDKKRNFARKMRYLLNGSKNQRELARKILLLKTT